MVTLKHIAQSIGVTTCFEKEAMIAHLLTDSRRLIFPSTTLFFAINTTHNDGHQFIPELIQRGVYNFVVNKNFDHRNFSNINFIQVDDVLATLQEIVACHRLEYNYPVIGITGSNGKTIVKEWLFQLLSNQYNIIRSPRSYNSQIGVPLSVWEMTDQHNLALFEAGISQQGEMQKLAKIIQPTIGILTSVGSAHQEGFKNEQSKLEEKCLLFKNANVVIAPQDIIKKAAINLDQKMVTWSRTQKATLTIQSEIIEKANTHIIALYKNDSLTLIIPFTDRASVDNVITCWVTLLWLKIPMHEIQQGVSQLRHLDMRMQIKKGINNCLVLNDSYSNDIFSLQLALEYATQQSGPQPITLILSDLTQLYASVIDYDKLIQQIISFPIKKLITIGPLLKRSVENNTSIQQANCAVYSFDSTAHYINHFDSNTFKDEFILIKGSRVFELERINALLQHQVHQTIAEINLTAMVNNYKKIKNVVGPSVKVMAMVKAFGYGSGSVEVARKLQFHHVDYLSVAYVDEGVELRKAGIHLPIMVMNVDETAFDTLLNYHLEPEIFSITQYQLFRDFIIKQGVPTFPIHLKLNTGMNRLGFDLKEIPLLSELVRQSKVLTVQSVFSHLSASGQSEYESFTAQQLESFNAAASQIEKALGYVVIKHIANSNAILNDKKYHLNMVRLGIALYGIGNSSFGLEQVVQLNTTISQIRHIEKGESVGYNRASILKRDSIIATVRLGYADGYSRRFGRGKGAMWVNGALAPIVGDVCMDMTMIDITDIMGVQEGDTVQVFGNQLPIEQVAEWAETIPYEILTSIGQRVKRIYIED